MTAPRLLDLFCGAGGAAMGYSHAGFDVTGVDDRPQPRYPFAFVQGDALAYVAAHGHEYDAIHASPPCQAYSEATPLHHRARLPRLIAPTREALIRAGVPFVIENVENARAHLLSPVMLCGTMFALPIWRHRYFECATFPPPAAGCCDHRQRPVTLHCGSNSRKSRRSTTVAEAREALGIHWMSLHELYDALPPAYTAFIGRALLAHLTATHRDRVETIALTTERSTRCAETRTEQSNGADGGRPAAADHRPHRADPGAAVRGPRRVVAGHLAGADAGAGGAQAAPAARAKEERLTR